ncbi:MAG TPA: short chain dehydrogenase [Legionella sp.]|nr:short chain dehydrogenase [Legionella sp.]
MRVLIIGGTGTIGQSVVKELSLKHEIIIAAHNQGDLRVDIADKNSIERMYQDVGKLDAVISTTGKVHFGVFPEITEEQFAVGLNNKLMGQVNLVSVGLNYINDQGSFTLTSGILNRDPIYLGSSAAMVNGAIDGFVKSAAIEMPRGIRINAVSPTVVAESMDKYADFFPGFVSVPAIIVAQAYVKSVEGRQTGQVYCVI